jgi:ComF family protein
VWRAFLDFLFPPFCIVCREKLEKGDRLVCGPCWGRAGGEEAETSPEERGTYARSAYPWNDTLGEILHRFKYGGFTCLGERLGRDLAELADKDPRLRTADLLVPIPLTRVRKIERGFNQSAVLARQVSRRLGIPVEEGAVRRVGRSRSQTTLSPEERLENVRGVFRVRRGERVRGKRIVLVDDVLTTGATTGELAAVLREAGASEVLVLTVARAGSDSSDAPSSSSRGRARPAPSGKRRSRSTTG